ncbi:PREDICTED: OTU domain-containing [Prunus dulcis]|uniref:PREDICTED: OTU domain-containing n=1 Tax=Prunus dulcis TaxID=3755 RepID=A0A5E4FT09_PRUDU|nr:PREDICTED: OTU domain-containing [Prunus dulcis]
MLTYELFDGDPYSNCGTYGTVNQDDANYYQGQYFKQDVYGNDTDCRNVEYDELFAHALQEELSLLAIEEEPEKVHVPKINGDIPSVDEATLDHQRLLNVL